MRSTGDLPHEAVFCQLSGSFEGLGPSDRDVKTVRLVDFKLKQARWLDVTSWGFTQPSLVQADNYDRSRDTAYGMRADAHIGEASHPGPSDIIVYSRRPTFLSLLIVSVACVLSLCDGMGCGKISLMANNATYDRYIAVEISEDAKRIARNANPPMSGIPHIDHSWHSDIHDITEQDIKNLGHNSIKLFLAIVLE